MSYINENSVNTPLNDSPAFISAKNELLRKYKIDTNEASQKITVLTIDELYDEYSDADIPLRYIQFTDNSVYVTVAQGCEDLIKDYLKKYSDDLFSYKGCDYLYSAFTEYMHRAQRYNNNPYAMDDELHKYMVYYTLDDNKNVRHDKIQNDTIQVNQETRYNNITSVYQPLSESSIYFGTLIDSDIVSIVGTNTNLQGKVIDIGVETHSSFRQKGFALSNIAAISDYLIKMGKIILYGCHNQNIHSINTAVSSGFQEIAKEKTLWFVGK